MNEKLVYYAVYKPYGMLSQFTPEAGRESLKSLHDFPSDVYPVGRLDSDSEGLLLLSNDKGLNHKLLNPDHGHYRTYLVQVDGDITEEACRKLEKGIEITIDGKKHFGKAINVKRVPLPEWVPERNPPVRFRKSIPTSWVELVLTEGKNRQVRKMTAAAGFPALRLIRTHMELLALDTMKPAEVKKITRQEVYRLLKIR